MTLKQNSRSKQEDHTNKFVGIPKNYMNCGYCWKNLKAVKKLPVEFEERDQGIELVKSNLEGNSYLVQYLKSNYLCFGCYNKFMRPENRRNFFIYQNGKLKFIESRAFISEFLSSGDFKTSFLVRVKTIGQKKEYMNGLVNADKGLYSFSHENLGCFSTENITEFLQIFNKCKELLERYSKRFLLELFPTKKDKEICSYDYEYIRQNRKDWRFIYAITIL